jgi:hypothetical protein
MPSYPTTNFNFPDFIRSRQDLKIPALAREQRIKQQGSPDYNWTPALIAASALIDIEVARQFPDAKKYEPLDTLELTNNDVVDITLTVNGNETYYLPAGVIKKRKDKPVWFIRLTNNSAAVATTAGKIVCLLSRSAMSEDKQVRGVY